MKVHSTAIERAILWASIEDYCGLWELVWEIISLYPNLSKKKNRDATSRCILHLISKDFVELLYCQEPYGEMIKIGDRNNCPNLLCNPKVWASPLPKSQSIRVSATKAGEKYYDDMY